MPTLIDTAGQPVGNDPWQLLPPDDTATGSPHPGPETTTARPSTPSDVTAAATTTPGETASSLLLSPDQMREHGEHLQRQGHRLGLLLEPADDPADAVEWFDRITLIAVRFPDFTDGRGYSTARLLRQRHGWTGPLRAVGDVGRDQLFLLRRVGFDSFTLRDSDRPETAAAAFSDFHERYQAAVDGPALFERRPLTHAV